MIEHTARADIRRGSLHPPVGGDLTLNFRPLMKTLPDATPRICLMTSFSKPFMTDSTMINTDTPTAIPSTETIEINEAKRFFRFARR
jgi:hypothetical protein